MKIRSIVIDDEAPAIEQMENYINRVPFLENLKSFDNAIEPIDFLRSNKVDLVFLDIEMEEFTGIQLIKTLSDMPQVILTTAYDQYAIEAFNLNVTDYLLKPVSFERFIKAVDKVHSGFSANFIDNTEIRKYKREYAFFKTEYRLQRIDFSDIIYVVGMREYLQIVTKHENIMVLMSFSEIEGILPKERFIRVHKSYIVAIDKIDNIERNRIFIGREIIPIGNMYKDHFLMVINGKV